MRSGAAPRPHIPEVDSLRGLAALAVFGQHLLLPFWQPDNAVADWIHRIEVTPAFMFMAGHEAVVWFFLLSGFVLSLPHVRGERVDAWPFLIRRLCRIYLPYLASLAVALACASVWNGRPVAEFSDWFNHVWATAPSWRDIAAHIVFIGRYDVDSINPALWSLVYELRVSLLFPWLVVFWMARGVQANLTWALICVVVGTIAGRFLSAEAETLSVIGTFGVGFLLAKHRHELVEWYRSQPVARRGLIAATGVGLYTIAPHLPVLLFHFRVIPITAGALLLTVVALGSPLAGRFLGLGPVRFLGRVSYSFYLYHAIVIIAVLHAGYGRVPVGVLLVATAFITTALAWVSYAFVERPGIALGRRLTAGAARPARTMDAT